MLISKVSDFFFKLFFLIFFTSACTPSHSEKETLVPDLTTDSPRFKKVFSQTKLVCFGRYAIQVPGDAKLVWGSASFPSEVEVINGGLAETRERINEDVEKLKRRDNTFEMIYEGKGPIAESLQIRYYDNEFSKADNDVYFNTYLMKNDLTFILLDATRERETQDFVAKRQMSRAESLRLREPDEVPKSSGYCLESGFMSSDFYNDQEMVATGIFIPSLPDVSFSISSNKDAYADYKKEDFEKMKREELGLLARIKGAQEIQGSHYPKRTVLREGKRNVQHWQGEESLVRRADGTHDFEWAFIGIPMDVANPSEFSVQMFTKVADNMVGAAEKASLSDEEAIAVWDQLLAGLKFRVKVPGAPEGSYYFLPGTKSAGEKP